jgi:hypothetical protein
MRTRSNILTISVIVLATGCNSKPAAPSKDKLAQQALASELDQWIAGQPSEGIRHPEILFANPIRYEIRAAVIDKSGTSLGFDAKEGEIVYKVTANLELEAKSGEPITKQMRYFVLVKKSGECEVKPAYR